MVRFLLALSLTVNLSHAAFITERVQWTPVAPEASLFLAKWLLEIKKIDASAPVILRYVTENSTLVSAKCESDVLRPSLEDKALKDAQNKITCGVKLSDQSLGMIVLDLSESLIDSWGNHFGPKGFLFDGKMADLFFQAGESLRKANVDSPYFNYDNQSLVTPAGSFDYIDYSLGYQPKNEYGKNPGAVSVNCTKEYFYNPEEERPSKPSKGYCVFIESSN